MLHTRQDCKLYPQHIPLVAMHLYATKYPPIYPVIFPLYIPTIKGSWARNFRVTNDSIIYLNRYITSPINHYITSTIPHINHYTTSPIKHYITLTIHHHLNHYITATIHHFNHYITLAAHLNHYITAKDTSHQSLHHLTHCITSIITAPHSLHHCKINDFNHYTDGVIVRQGCRAVLGASSAKWWHHDMLSITAPFGPG